MMPLNILLQVYVKKQLIKRVCTVVSCKARPLVFNIVRSEVK